MSTTKAPSTALLRMFSPFQRTASSTLTSRAWAPAAQVCRKSLQQQQQQVAAFSASAQRFKRKDKVRKEPKITHIRYYLYHPLTPRPLRFSRNRALRHWTIHRAWRLYQHKRHEAQERALERQYNSMYSACEALRLMDNEGFTEDERESAGLTPLPNGSKDMGRLYRIAMLKHDIWKGVPIEYARIQTESPGREPWNHGWRR